MIGEKKGRYVYVFCGVECLNSKLCILSLTLCVSSVNGVESLQLSGELRLHGALALMRLEDQ